MTNKSKEEEKKFFLETKATLKSKDEKMIIAKLRELKTKGNASILPLILDLLESSSSDDIIQEVLNIIGDLRDQNCAPVIISYIDNKKLGKHVSAIVSSCWQSMLDFHAHLSSFATCFLDGDYQTALEAFTVIEEMLWKSTDEQIQSCKKILVENKKTVTEEKRLLYRELIKVLDEGKSGNPEMYPELYE